MKKAFKFLLLTLTMCLLLTLSATAARSLVDETDSGILYSITDENYVVIEGYSLLALNLKIPSEIDGMPVKYISSNAFYGNDNIYSLEISEGIEDIGTAAFSNCKNLVSVKLPSTIKKISDSAFMGCSSLSSVTISEGTVSIESGAFENCKLLGSVRIPDSVSYIGPGAFYGCEKLIFECGNNEYAKQYAENNFIPTSHYSAFWIVNWTVIITVTAITVFIIFKKTSIIKKLSAKINRR